MITTVNKVELSKVEGDAWDIDWNRTEHLTVANHAKGEDIVVITLPDGTKYAVLADDLIAAVTNAKNTGAR